MPRNIGSLTKSLLSAVGESAELFDAEGNPAPILRSFDWASHGVSVPYVIFFTGRCGSTWLTSMLKKTQLASNPDEFLNEEVARNLATRMHFDGLADYFEQAVRREAQNGFFGLEIDPTRLDQVQAAIEFSGVFPPNITKTFFLYRRDILAQAWSWAAAKKSGVWHVQNGKKHPPPRESSAESSLPTAHDVAREVYNVRRGEEALSAFFVDRGYSPFSLEYETLVVDPVATVMTLLLNLGIPADACRKIRLPETHDTSRLVYEQKHSVLLDFHELYPAFGRAILRDRMMPAKVLHEMLDLWAPQPASNATSSG